MNENLFFLAEQFAYCLLIVWGLSIIIQTKIWIRITKLIFSQDDKLDYFCICLGLVFFPQGLFIVITHNDWEMSPSVIVTLLGWAILIKSLLYLLWPRWVLKFKGFYEKSDLFLTRYFRIAGAIYIILGLLICYNFWVF